jgi:anaerobic selenocysteine-containing dehydrogenase
MVASGAYVDSRASSSGPWGAFRVAKRAISACWSNPRRSWTAASADEFVLIKPGTHGAVALGIAYILIKERHYGPMCVDAHVKHLGSWVDEQGVEQMRTRDNGLSTYYTGQSGQYQRQSGQEDRANCE